MECGSPEETGALSPSSGLIGSDTHTKSIEAPRRGYLPPETQRRSGRQPASSCSCSGDSRWVSQTPPTAMPGRSQMRRGQSGRRGPWSRVI